MRNKKETKLARKLLLIGIILISIILLIFLVSALTDDEKASLESELNSLISDLNSKGYSWSVDPNLNEFINNDNLMLSTDNKMLT